MHDDNFIRIVPEGYVVDRYINLRGPLRNGWAPNFPTAQTAMTTQCVQLRCVCRDSDVVTITCLRYRTLTGALGDHSGHWGVAGINTINDGMADDEHDRLRIEAGANRLSKCVGRYKIVCCFFLHSALL